MTERLSLSELARWQQSAAGFSPRPAAPTMAAGQPVHFSPDRPAAAPAGSPFPDPEADPLRAAWADGHRAGLAEGDATDMGEMAARVAGEIERIGRAADDGLAERLILTVVALARQLLADAPFDEGALARRVELALARLGDTPPLTCRCHPDAEAAARALLPDGVAIHVDPALAPNALTLDTATGGLADGPEEWAEALRAALAEC